MANRDPLCLGDVEALLLGRYAGSFFNNGNPPPSPTNQLSCRSEARTKRRHEQPGSDEQVNLQALAADHRPELVEIDLQLLGGVSKRIVERGSASSARRSGATSRLMVRRLTLMPFWAASSWRTTSALPAWQRSRDPTNLGDTLEPGSP